ncbi:MAG: hypothetical protein V7L21_32100 [Nostoc sp.]|uniref:hypothetical protein n=1 Tax=unclassified Nostoc TaxID=2593658 RepID=UPI0025D86DB7|nr:hypothetical protein [Nostoc sp. NMS9]MBN3939912.1 hypothetical protein [Nostoc sp. NMS9]
MHHSLKIKILDLDHVESIVEQDITDVEAEKIVGGSSFIEGTVCDPNDLYCLMNVPVIKDDPLPPCAQAFPDNETRFTEIASKLSLTKTSINVLTEKLDLSLGLSKSAL